MPLLKIIFVFVLFTTQTMAQCVNGISTDPTNPILIRTGVTVFDWTALTYQVNCQNIAATSIPAPFAQLNNSQVSHFLNNKDRLPQDGWELVKYDLGFNYDGSLKNDAPGQVFFILYNRYTAVLRVFICGDRNNSFNGAKLQIIFSNGTGSSALNSTSGLLPVETFVSSANSVSEYSNNNHTWFYSDFYMAYDPCTCLFESEMTIQLRLITNSVISLMGSFTGSVTSITNNSGTVANDGKYSFKDLQSAALKAQKAYKDMNGVVNDLDKAIFDSNPPTTEQTAKKDSLVKTVNESKLKRFLKGGLKAVPYVSTAFELIDFFTGGGNKSAGPTTVQLMPMAINAEMKLNGTLSGTYLYGDIIFYTPGSNNAATLDIGHYPIYNEVLGVFNLLEPPKMLKWTDILDSNWKSYMLSNPLKWVYNPASKMIPTEVFGAIVFEFDSATTVAHETITNQFVKIDKNHYGTRIVPIGALQDFSLHVPTAPYPQNIYIKIFVNSARFDASSETQNVLFVGNFKVTVTEGYFSSGQNSLMGYAEDLTINNQTLSLVNNTGAWDKVLITNSTLSSNSSKVITGGTSVEIGANVTINPGITTLAGGAPNGNNTTTPMQTQSQINTFCTSSFYDNSTRYFRKNLSESVGTAEEPDVFSTTVFPNPASNTVNLSYHVSVAGHVSINFLDFTGRLISRPLENVFHDKGDYEQPFNAKDLPNGVYIFQIRSNGLEAFQRVVIDH
jgi:hypothetical protein